MPPRCLWRPGDLRIQYKLMLTYSALLLSVTFVSNASVYFLVEHAVRVNIESQLSTTNETIVTMVRASAQLSVRNRLRAIAEKNREITQHFYARALRGELSEANAKQQAQDVMLSQSIGDTGYLYVLDAQGTLVMHPKPALLGRDLSSHGFIREQLRRRSGYLEYDWKNPDDAAWRPKALYMEDFKPWGWIISASSYREEFRQLVHVEDFRDRILSVKFGETGYPYVLDSSGRIVIHPVLSGSVSNVTDSSGHYFVREICARKTGSIVYTWQNPGETRFRKKLALFTYLPEYDWIVVSASYHEEFYAPLRWMRNVFIVSTLLTLLLLVPLSMYMSSTITRPIKSLMRQLRRAVDGDLAVRVAPESRDEVGRLAEYFNGFMIRLEQQQAERTRSEAEKERYAERLRQSEKLEAVGQLAGGIAHDFNNMLAAIAGHAELMAFEPLTATQRTSVDQVLLTTSRATSLTRSLLDFSRKSTTRLELVDGHQLLLEIINLVRHTIDKRITIVTDLGASASKLLADPGRLQHAVLNIILNSRDAMPNGGEIRVATSVCPESALPNRAAKDPEAPYLRIAVTDQGTGMDAATLAHAFEPFFTTKEQGKGTGLGLTSVYGCVKAHDGDVQIVSEPGAGTTVELFLALLIEPRLEVEEEFTDDLPTGTGHVLIAEDEPAVRQFISDALCRLGYTTSSCADGLEAVRHFARHHHEIDLVLLDLVMPGLGGRDVFAKLQVIDRSVPVLLCSGYSDRGDMRGPLPTEAAGFLQKPYRLSKLAQSVADYIRKRATVRGSGP